MSQPTVDKILLSKDQIDLKNIYRYLQYSSFYAAWLALQDMTEAQRVMEGPCSSRANEI